MGLFGKSFEEKVQDALNELNALGLGLRNLDAEIDGKVVTLKGTAPSMDVKRQAMDEFNNRVKTKNTVNMIRVDAPEPEPEPVAEEPAAPAEQIYEVVSGDTLGAIAQRFYGKASLYMKIFEANRDILDNPDLIKVGQKLKIPALEE